MKNKNNLKEKDKQMVKQPMLFNEFLNQIEDVKAQLKNEGFDCRQTLETRRKKHLAASRSRADGWRD